MSEIINILIGRQPTSIAEVQQLCEQVQALRNERDRLREALGHLSKMCTCNRPAVKTPDGGVLAPGPHLGRCVKSIAQAALTPAAPLLTLNEAME